MRTCGHCGDELSRRNPKYCSNRCQKACEWGIVCKAIVDSGVIPRGSHKLAKRWFRERAGHQCAICRGTEWAGQPIPLMLDHIDGNSGNWTVNNLRMICPNCDALLPTFKNRNKGKGRAVRRKRYADGLSY
jgi:hypothetical protein